MLLSHRVFDFISEVPRIKPEWGHHSKQKCPCFELFPGILYIAFLTGANFANFCCNACFCPVVISYSIMYGMHSMYEIMTRRN